MEVLLNTLIEEEVNRILFFPKMGIYLASSEVVFQHGKY